MGVEWVAVGVVLAAGAVFVGFPVGVGVGYAWRDRISRARQVRFLVERERRRAELDGADTALASADIRRAFGTSATRVQESITRQTHGANTAESKEATD